MIQETEAWQALAEHAETFHDVHLRGLFADDPDRGQRLAVEVDGLYYDYSKTHVTDQTVDLLIGLARAAGLEERRDAMFAGADVNTTEGRPALHTALRAPRGEQIEVAGRDPVADVHAVRDRMAELATAVRTGRWTGATGRPIATVVNLGIGGSDLGPRMAAAALDHRIDGPAPRFVSNVDAGDLAATLADLDPATTLFVVCSKSFTTTETLTNARTARAWVTDALGDAAVDDHFVAVSARADAVADFGLDPDDAFALFDWVGGRYSLPGAVGLSLMIAAGPAVFDDLLAGYRTTDEHFRDAPLRANAPALAGLLAVWYRSFLGSATRAVIPYLDRLALLPAYLQQLEMESNGKRVTEAGGPVAYPTAPVVWGRQGTDGQHAFFQLLHQGTELVPVDLIGVCHPPADGAGRSPLGVERAGRHHDLLVANLLAQSQALAFGRNAEETAAEGIDESLIPHRTFPGNRPSTTILLDELTPRRLGQLIAHYEHSVFTQATIWEIDPFDQWGVELGKQLAADLVDELTATGPISGQDSSTATLIQRYRAGRSGG